MAIENALALKETEEARGARARAARARPSWRNRAKDEFLATVSHELRTPLNAILGWTVTLRRRKPPEEVDRALAIVERNARVQTKLIEDVLDISRIISGKLALNLGPTNVPRPCRRRSRRWPRRRRARASRPRIEVADESLTITADADRLQQIVWNLLSNAVKFTPKGGAVAAARLPGRLGRLHLRERHGRGNPGASTLPRVFERFQQADASTTRRHGGLGLGLAIVKQLVSAHGGTVTAEQRRRGEGGDLRRALARAIRGPGGQPGRASGPGHGGAGRGAGRGPAARWIARSWWSTTRKTRAGWWARFSGEQGAEVHLAASAREALEQLGTVKPDVVVSDIGMPETDGLSLIRKIRSLPTEQGGRTPAVALTAYARVDDAQRAFAAGYQRHVAKPVEAVQLATVVANLGGRSLGGV